MQLTNRQIEFIEGILTEEILEEDLDTIHSYVYDRLLDENVISFDSDDESDHETLDEIYESLVFEYLTNRV
jgi:hypothetical protein